MAASGLGKTEEARAALEDARQAFAEHGIEYDCAQVSLELTVLYLEESTRARDLAREALEIFQRQDVPREMLAALTGLLPGHGAAARPRRPGPAAVGLPGSG